MRQLSQGMMVAGAFVGAAARLHAQTPNIPVFSIWATEVTDTFGGPNKCTSCPTQNIPFSEVAPGDVIRVELYVSGWDAQPQRGRCNGDPQFAEDGFCSILGNPCEGTRCRCAPRWCGKFTGCQSCGPCIQNTCQPFPLLSAYTVTLEGDSFVGCSGQLIPYRVPCDSLDCAVLEDATCPCAHFYDDPLSCTCADPQTAACDGLTNLCGIGATGFIESDRSDYLFLNYSFGMGIDKALESVSFESDGDVTFSATLFEPFINAVADNGTRSYLGTMLLKIAPNAAGTFNISYVKDHAATFAVDSNGQPLDGVVYQDLTIYIPDCFPIDIDNDGVPNLIDNCPLVSNLAQADCDINGVGDVCDQVCGGQIDWATFPTDGAVDAREDVDEATGIPLGIEVFGASFTCFVGIAPTGNPPGALDFQVTDTTGQELVVMAVASQDACFLDYAVIIADPQRPGEWTTIAVTVEELYVQGMSPAFAALVADVGFLPGDVDGTTWTDVFDVAALRQALMQGGGLTPVTELSLDIDRSGMLTAYDLIREMDLLNGANTTRSWNGILLPPKPH